MGEPEANESARRLTHLSPDDARTRGIAAFLLDNVPFETPAQAASGLAEILAGLVASGIRLTLDGIEAYASPHRWMTLDGKPGASPLVEDKGFGQVDVLWQIRTAGVYRLRIAPGRAIPTHEHRRMDESELVLDDGLLLQGVPVAAGTARRWPLRLPHRYDNPTDRELAVLCVDRPAFEPDDEVEVPDPAEGFVQVPATVWFT